MNRLMMKALAVLLAVTMVAGITGTSIADNHNIPPLSVSASGDEFEAGDTITITGSIKNIDLDMKHDVTIQVSSPDGNRVGFAQTTPTDDGEFTASISTGGPLWKNSGEYMILVVYSSDKETVFVSYTASAMEPAPVAPEPEPVCGPGTEMVDGVCQVITEPDEPPEDDVMVPPPPPPVEPPEITCGAGTELVDGECVAIEQEGGGGCLIATAAFGTEMAPQVQYLREIRDNTVMSTGSGATFMSGFNSLYYSISPQIADMERENPLFRELVRVAITPMLASLSIMGLAENGSEVSVLGTGLLVITLNIMMYLAAPVLIGFKAYGKIAKRNNASQ